MAELRSDLASQPCAFDSRTHFLEPELPLLWNERLGGGGLEHEAPEWVLGFGEGQVVISRREKSYKK